MTVKERKKRKHVGQCFKKSNLFKKKWDVESDTDMFRGRKRKQNKK